MNVLRKVNKMNNAHIHDRPSKKYQNIIFQDQNPWIHVDSLRKRIEMENEYNL